MITDSCLDFWLFPWGNSHRSLTITDSWVSISSHVTLLWTLCIHHENNSLTRDRFLCASHKTHTVLVSLVVGPVYSMYSLCMLKISLLRGVIGCYIHLTHPSSIH